MHYLQIHNILPIIYPSPSIFVYPDVYATWCGPCKLMAPFLEEAASELGDKVRVAKMDSDENPEWSGKLRVQGLPTVIVFDGETGKELERVEGALMKDQLVQLASKYA